MQSTHPRGDRTFFFKIITSTKCRQKCTRPDVSAGRPNKCIARQDRTCEIKIVAAAPLTTTVSFLAPLTPRTLTPRTSTRNPKSRHLIRFKSLAAETLWDISCAKKRGMRLQGKANVTSQAYRRCGPTIVVRPQNYTPQVCGVFSTLSKMKPRRHSRRFWLHVEGCCQQGNGICGQTLGDRSTRRLVKLSGRSTAERCGKCK